MANESLSTSRSRGRASGLDESGPDDAADARARLIRHAVDVVWVPRESVSPISLLDDKCTIRSSISGSLARVQVPSNTVSTGLRGVLRDSPSGYPIRITAWGNPGAPMSSPTRGRSSAKWHASSGRTLAQHPQPRPREGGVRAPDRPRAKRIGPLACLVLVPCIRPTGRRSRLWLGDGGRPLQEFRRAH